MKNILIFTFCALLTAVSANANAGCSSCGASGASNLPGGKTGPSFHLSMGKTQYGQSAGNLIFNEQLPGLAICKRHA